MATAIEEYQKAHDRIAYAVNSQGADIALNYCILMELITLYYFMLHDTKEDAMDAVAKMAAKTSRIIDQEWHKKDELILAKFKPLS